MNFLLFYILMEHSQMLESRFETFIKDKMTLQSGKASLYIK